MTKRLPSGADSAVAAADLRWMRFDRARVFSWAQTIGIIVLLAVIFATPGFLAGPSILSLLTTVSFIGCVAIGMTLITISGNIMSFALGATVGVTAMVFILASIACISSSSLPMRAVPSLRHRAPRGNRR